jgi:hypothetical protein
MRALLAKLGFEQLFMDLNQETSGFSLPTKYTAAKIKRNQLQQVVALLTGHSHLKGCLSKLGLSNSPICERCLESPYTTQSTYSNWGTIEHGIPHGSILGPLLFIIYINDLPSTINTLADPIIFADDMSATISSKNFDDVFMLSNGVVCLMGKWIAANKLTLNSNKTNIIKFITCNSPQFPISIGYEDKYIEESVLTKCLGLQTDRQLNWQTPIDQLVPKLSGACYA